MELSGTISYSKDSWEVLRTQEGITECLTSGGPSPESLLSIFWEWQLPLLASGGPPPSLFSVILCETSSHAKEGHVI